MIKILGTPVNADKDTPINPRMFNDGVRLDSLISEAAATALSLERYQTLILSSADSMIHTQMLKERALEELNEYLPTEKLENMEIEDFQSVFKHYLKIHEGILSKIKGELASLSVVSGVIHGVNMKFNEVQAILQEKARERARIFARKILYYVFNKIDDTHKTHNSLIGTMSEENWFNNYSSVVKANDYVEGIRRDLPLCQIQSDIYKVTDSKLKKEGEFLAVTALTTIAHEIWSKIVDNNGHIPLSTSTGRNLGERIVNYVVSRVTRYITGNPQFIDDLRANYGITCLNINNNAQGLGLIKIIKRVNTKEEAAEYGIKSINLINEIINNSVLQSDNINDLWQVTPFYEENQEEIDNAWESRNDNTDGGERSSE